MLLSSANIYVHPISINFGDYDGVWAKFSINMKYTFCVGAGYISEAGSLSKGIESQAIQEILPQYDHNITCI